MITFPRPEYFFRGFVVFSLMLTASSCNEDLSAIQATAQFTQSKLSFSENSGAQTIGLRFDRPAVVDGEILITSNAQLPVCFVTEPAAQQGQVKLLITKGQSVVLFKIIPIDNQSLDGCRVVRFNISGVSEGLKSGIAHEITISVNDDESPASATFANQSITVNEDDPSPGRITLSFTNPTPADGVLVVKLQTSSIYEQDYYTKPASLAGRIFLQVPKGATSATVEVYPVNDTALKGDRHITLRMVEATGGVVAGSDDLFWCTITEDDGNQLIPISPIRRKGGHVRNSE